MNSQSRFQKLLEPYQIGNVRTRNRIIKTASGTSFWQPGEYRITNKAKAFYEALARGGAGLVMVESPITEYPFDEADDVRMRIDDDKYIPQVSELTQAIHKYGCPTFIQIYHRGPWYQPYAPRRPHFAASPVLEQVSKSQFDLHSDKPPREITIAEIEELIELFAVFAERFRKAGFDGMEINSASDSLFATFVSRFWNKRQDIYGQKSLEDRTRFLVQTIRAIKKRVGQDFPINVIINALEAGGGDEGITFDESKGIAKILEKEGVAALHVRSHWFGNHLGSYNHDNLFYPEPQIPIKEFPRGLDWSHLWRGVNVPAAMEIKSVVSIPVITVSGIDPDMGEEILKQGKADFIGICRPLFADPELPNKLASGRFDDIAPCTHCSTCQKMNHLPKECRVNAALGTEQYEIKKAEKKKRVTVVGGGPAGMEAARVAAIRGHDVTLYEKAHNLGGSLPIAATVKGLEIEDLPALVRYLSGQIKKNGVNIKLGKEFILSELEGSRPDVVILATGGIPTVPDIPGINRRNVINASYLHNILKTWLRFFSPGLLRSLTNIWMPVGKSVVVIGSMIASCQLAEFLTKRGRKVTIVDSSETLGEGMVPERKNRLLWWFNIKGVKTITGVKYDRIADNGLTLLTKDNQKVTIEADSIIPALPLSTNVQLLASIKEKVGEVYAIGDCQKPGLIVDAIADGWRIANSI